MVGLICHQAYQLTFQGIFLLSYCHERILNFLRLPQAYIYIYAWVEKSLYNMLFIGCYNLWLIRLLVQLFPKGVAVLLYIGFQFDTSTAKNSPRYQNMDHKVEVWRLVAYHCSPVGGHMGQLRHIITLLAAVRLLGYHKLSYRFT